MLIEPSGTEPRCFALVPCAGSGSRAGAAGPKQYAPLAGRPLVAHTLDALRAVPALRAILVVLAPEDTDFEARVGDGLPATVWPSRVGGASRAESVCNGLRELQARGARPHDWVLVHDAARCLLRPTDVERLLAACRDDEVGGLLALPVADTLKRAGPEAPGRVQATLDREGTWAAQTPQMFRLGLLLPALQAALSRGGAGVTDEAGAVEALGHRPRLVPGDGENFKVTYPGDFERAARVLAGRSRPELPRLRIGEGCDIHALVPGRPLVLGGVTVPHSAGLLGHSDADALLHATTDALLGGAGLGDIGRHFPDTDERFRGADSAALLVEAHRRVVEAGWLVVNVDATVVAQAPRLAPHIPAMQARIAACLGLTPDRVNVKAKTAERMGPVGEGRAIEARAVCLLQRHEGFTPPRPA